MKEKKHQRKTSNLDWSTAVLASRAGMIESEKNENILF